MGIKELRAKALKKAREKVREEKFKPDHLVIQAIAAIDELDEINNLFSERVKNWYALHYPELTKLVKNPDTYFELIKEMANREQMTVKKLEKYIGKERAEKVAHIAEKTMGAQLKQKDLDQVARLAALALQGRQERDELARYVEYTTEELCPNVHALIGGILAARLISKAGSLEHLAQVPASTVQVYGAEKALFAHLKTGSKPPKHGLLFGYSKVQQAPKGLKGKIARIVANKISIAARIDFFGGKLDTTLKHKMDLKVEHALGAKK